jgi:chromatin remodeling complex protein RSC6
MEVVDSSVVVVDAEPTAPIKKPRGISKSHGHKKQRVSVKTPLNVVVEPTVDVDASVESPSPVELTHSSVQSLRNVKRLNNKQILDVDTVRELGYLLQIVARETKHSLSRLRMDETGGSLRNSGPAKSASEITPEFCDFLGLPPGSKVSRHQAFSQVNKYLDDHNLKGCSLGDRPKSNRCFLLDEKLTSLFGAVVAEESPNQPTVGQLIHLQKYFKPLFVPKTVTV